MDSFPAIFVKNSIRTFPDFVKDDFLQMRLNCFKVSKSLAGDFADAEVYAG